MEEVSWYCVGNRCQYYLSKIQIKISFSADALKISSRLGTIGIDASIALVLFVETRSPGKAALAALGNWESTLACAH